MSSHLKHPQRMARLSLGIYYLGTVLYLVYTFLQTTLFSAVVPNAVFSLAKYLCLAIFVVRILTNRYDERQVLLLFGGLLLAVLIYQNSGDTSIVVLMLFLLSSLNCRSRIIVEIYFWTALALIAVTIGSALVGVIDNYHYQVNGSVRYAFGFLYSTDFAAHIFYLCLAYVYIRGRQLRKLEFFIPVVLAALVFLLTRAKLDTALLILILLAAMDYRRLSNQQMKKFDRWLYLFPVLMAALSIGASWLFTPTNGILVKIDDFFTHRLAMGHLALYEYPLRWFGQYVFQQGSGGLTFPTGLTTTGTNLAYFFIDSSYIKVLLSFGIVFLGLYLFGMSHAIRFNVAHQAYLLPLVLVIVCISSIIDHHLLDIAYNPFVVCVLANNAVGGVGSEERIYHWFKRDSR
ncbi:hypothetical protein [Levilactobacillus enshiensis]|uniref:hypothetical protein n=1 Tax=Levilactobacillus enshiensis TaxID=2590213 RepID=UPI001179C84C|nr:hypothetical protein [Levilactobacillus enshiensis]